MNTNISECFKAQIVKFNAATKSIPQDKGTRVRTCSFNIRRIVLKGSKYYLLLQWNDPYFVDVMQKHVETFLESDAASNIDPIRWSKHNFQVVGKNSTVFVFSRKITVNDILLFDQRNWEIPFTTLKQGMTGKAIIEWNANQWKLLQLQVSLEHVICQL